MCEIEKLASDVTRADAEEPPCYLVGPVQVCQALRSWVEDSAGRQCVQSC